MNNKQKVWTLAALMAVAAACKKTPLPTPEPTPNTPTDTINPTVPADTIAPFPGDTITPIPGDTITPVIPTDTIIPIPGDTIVPTPDTITPVPGGQMVKFYYEGGVNFPPLDSVWRYALDPAYDSIYIMVRLPGGSSSWTPGGFHAARDSLSKRFNISPKVRGGWGFTPYQILPDCDSVNIGVKGMIRSDSTQFSNWHYGVYPVINNKSGKTNNTNHYKGNRVLSAARSR